MDPRAKLMRTMCHTLLEHLKLDDPLLHVAQALEEVALKDEYFVERKLYPNVDFVRPLPFARRAPAGRLHVQAWC